MTRPVILDLFSGAGGAACGYHRAGFDVVGVDHVFQPRYPFRFIQADALEYLAEHGKRFDAIHASPPCQRYSIGTKRWKGRAAAHPDLVGPTRELLEQTGVPWVMENVIGAPLKNAVMLCGTMFGLRVYRHRIFETSFWLWQLEHPRHREVIGAHRYARDAGSGNARKKVNANGWASVTGGIGDVKAARKAMGIDWMVEDELTQAIPPAYCHFIGRQLRENLVP